MPALFTFCTCLCLQEAFAIPYLSARDAFVRSAALFQRKAQMRPSGVAAAASGAESASEFSKQDATEWLLQHRPKHDGTTDDFVAAHAWEAVKTRETYPWAQEVPLQLFQEYVLPYTHFDEKPELWRAYFFDRLEPSVQGATSLKDAAIAVQQGIWTAFGDTAIHFKSNSTPEVLSPMADVLVKRYGSCTAMSIFLADGLRSCGVPARVVGIAEWNRPDKGNHNWVEAWFDDRWNFIDAVPGERNWNEAWFKETARESIPGGINGIYTPTWNSDEVTGNYIVGWRDPHLSLPAIELTSKYHM
jgi:hypothetical protein